MRNFYLSCKFCTLTINLSETVLPRHIPLSIIVFGRESLRNVLNASQRRVNKHSLTWWYALKTSWRCLENIFQDVFKTCWRRLEDVLKTFLKDVLKTSWRSRAKTNILVLTKTSWRPLEDVFWRRKSKANMFVLIKTSWRRLLKTKMKDVLKTSSRRLHQDECFG